MPPHTRHFLWHDWRNLLVVSVGFCLPSSAVVQRFLGNVGLLLYVLVSILLVVLYRQYWDILDQRLSGYLERYATMLAAVTFAVVLLAFAMAYPIADSGVVGGGSDGDDALNIATVELLNGRYPYHPMTYLGNPISPMPGSLFLAVPFVVLGNSAYQNLFWLVAFFVGSKLYWRASRRALLSVWLVLAVCPAVWHAVVVGSDYISNGIYVLLAMLWLIETAPHSQSSRWQPAVAASALGVALSSRANYLLLVPLILFALARGAGWRAAVLYIALTCVVFVVVTVPFYLYDPQGFSPLHTVDELGRFRTVLPYAGYVLPLANGVLSVLIAVFGVDTAQDSRGFLLQCLVVLAFPVLSGLVLSIIQRGQLDFHFAAFGALYVFFGAMYFPLLGEEKMMARRSL